MYEPISRPVMLAHSGFSIGALPAASPIRLRRIFTDDKNLIVRKAGSVKKEIKPRIMKKIMAWSEKNIKERLLRKDNSNRIPAVTNYSVETASRTHYTYQKVSQLREKWRINKHITAGILRIINELKTYTVYGLQFHYGLGLKVFPDLGDKYIHAAPQKVVILTPYADQYFVAL